MIRLRRPASTSPACFASSSRRRQTGRTLKERAVQAIFDVVQSHCPNFRGSLLGYRALSPADLENEFGLTGGDIFHGQLSLDQLFSMRPLLGYARYRGPIAGLVSLWLGCASRRRRDRRAGA